MKKGNIFKSISRLLFIYFLFAISAYLLLHGKIIANVKNKIGAKTNYDNSKSLTYDITSTKNNICEIHNLIMTKESIRMYYGLVMLNDTESEYLSLRREYFPNSNDSINGGCLYSDIKYSVEYICAECNNERDKYKNLLGLKYTP